MLSENKDGFLIEELANGETLISVADNEESPYTADPDISEYFASLDHEKMQNEAILLATEKF